MYLFLIDEPIGFDLCQFMRELRNQYRSRKRILIRDQVGVYHVISRTTCQQFLFGPEEKERFCQLLFQQAAFAGVEVLSYCIMSNHVHLLLRVDPNSTPSDQELLRRYADYYGMDKVPLSAYSVDELKLLLRQEGNQADAARKQVLSRMNNLPAFMRELKQRFSIWYNHKHTNQGTIWAARYKSLIVEDCPESLTRIAAYIDLNPVRAEIVADPKDYRWCSYAAAMAGKQRARTGLIRLFNQERDFAQVIRSYRIILFGKGYQTKGSATNNLGRISPERLEEVMRRGGEVPLHELLRVRIRYFGDGLALGSHSFLKGIFEDNRIVFGDKRKRGGAPLPAGSWGQLHIMRDLKKRIYG